MTVDNNKAMAWPQSRVARTEDKSILSSSEQQKQEFYFGLLNEFLLIGSNRLDMDVLLQLRRLDALQITHQIYLKILPLIFSHKL